MAAERCTAALPRFYRCRAGSAHSLHGARARRSKRDSSTLGADTRRRTTVRRFSGERLDFRAVITRRINKITNEPGPRESRLPLIPRPVPL